jgi:hypothetical protein
MGQACGLKGQYRFGAVQVGPLQAVDRLDLLQGQKGKQLQESRHVRVIRIDPELVIIIG